MHQRYSWAMWLTLLVAFFLQLVALSGVANIIRPYWLLVVASFWVLVTPNQVKLVVIWLMGLFIDVITGGVLGEHAFSLVLCLGILMAIRRRVSMSPRPQQGLMIGVLCFLYALCLGSIQHVTHYPALTFWHWLAPIFSVLVWWVFAVYMHSRIVRHDVI